MSSERCRCSTPSGFASRVAAVCGPANADAREPGTELRLVGDPAAEADVAVGADDDQSRTGRARQPVDRDAGAEVQAIEMVRVAVHQHVDTGPGKQGVQPDP